MLRVPYELSMCKTISLPTVLSPWPLEQYFCQIKIHDVGKAPNNVNPQAEDLVAMYYPSIFPLACPSTDMICSLSLSLKQRLYASSSL